MSDKQKAIEPIPLPPISQELQRLFDLLEECRRHFWSLSAPPSKKEGE